IGPSVLFLAEAKNFVDGPSIKSPAGYNSPKCIALPHRPTLRPTQYRFEHSFRWGKLMHV
ncbi:hypothetical protein, partial [Agrobacterium sp. MCAB5]|uniref:hypothetical protein n=1 Tax=Agrobacterium sp. MCAB5 TaxID=3233042 RepID=UPI003F918BA9